MTPMLEVFKLSRYRIREEFYAEVCLRATCSSADKPPRNGEGLRLRSECAGRAGRAVPGGQCGVHAMTSEQIRMARRSCALCPLPRPPPDAVLRGASPGGSCS